MLLEHLIQCLLKLYSHPTSYMIMGHRHQTYNHKWQHTLRKLTHLRSGDWHQSSPTLDWVEDSMYQTLFSQTDIKEKITVWLRKTTYVVSMLPDKMFVSALNRTNNTNIMWSLHLKTGKGQQAEGTICNDFYTFIILLSSVSLFCILGR